MANFITTLSEYIEALRPLWNVLEPIKSLSAVSIIIGAASLLWGKYSYKKVDLSCGSFKVRRKDFTWQKLTPLVSRIFYDGGNVPDEVRKEILKLTELPVKDIVYNRSLNMECQGDGKTSKEIHSKL